MIFIKIQIKALQEFQTYHHEETNIDEKFKQKSKIAKTFESLKKINKIFLKEINLIEEDEIRQEYIIEIFDQFKVKKRLKYSAFFWLSFYYLGSMYVSRSLNFPPHFKYLLMSFFIFPNLFHYYRKFQSINTKIEEILLRHNINRYVTIKDKEKLDNFIQTYLNFVQTNKLL
jgi:hypothetical protein